MAAGILINGKIVPVDGLKVITKDDDPRCKLPAGKWREDGWTRQAIIHKTIADDPESVIPGAGEPGGAVQTIDAWQGGVDGAHGVFDYDSTLWQLADLQTVETFHARTSNAWSFGFEIKEQPGGGCYYAQLAACVAATIAGCVELGIQLQMQKRGTYTGHPIARMSVEGATPGGPDMVGIFGHRLNDEDRGRWDPGDQIWDLFAAAGVEEFDFAKAEDRAMWMTRQQVLQAGKFYVGEIDGVPGPATRTALLAAGYRNGIFALGKM